MTNTPTTKTTATRKGSQSKSTKPAAKSTTKAAAKAAPKPAAKSTKAAAKPVAVVEPKPAPKRALDAKSSARLVELHVAANTATEAFELAVVELLRSGESPTHVAKALDIANSSVRRIGFRHGFGEAPADKRNA